MARLSQEEINDVRSKADIVDVITNYVSVHKKGRNYVCVCPFHDDHAPSLQINSDKQIFKCFACGAGGNVFGFVQRYEKLSFIESVYKVAQICNIEMNQPLVIENHHVNKQYQELYNTLNLAIQYCEYQLQTPIATDVKAYLLKRGINDDLIKMFQLGYNPTNNMLSKFLQAKRIDDQVILNCGLAYLTAYGLSDAYNHRIVIPIHDEYGNPVGFSARRLNDEGAKYINTSENEIYHKGDLIYNYHRAKEYARKQGCIYLVEGAMDVITFAKIGIYHVIATLGTALTNKQFSMIKKLGVKVILAYDGDQAGKIATYKFGKIAIQQHLEFEIVDNRYGLDGDEIIDAYGIDEFKAMSAKTISWCDFLFQFLPSRYNLNNYSQKKEFAMEIASSIIALKQDFEKNKYYLRLKELTGFDMRPQLSGTQQTTNRQFKQNNIVALPKSGKEHAQFEILSQMLCGQSACNYFKQTLGFLLDDVCNKLALYIIDYYRSYDVMDIALLIDMIQENEVVDLLIEVSSWELAKGEVQNDVLKEAIFKIEICMLDDQIKELGQQIKQIVDPVQKAQYALERNRLIQQRNEKFRKDGCS